MLKILKLLVLVGRHVCLFSYVFCAVNPDVSTIKYVLTPSHLNFSMQTIRNGSAYVKYSDKHILTVVKPWDIAAAQLTLGNNFTSELGSSERRTVLITEEIYLLVKRDGQIVTFSPKEFGQLPITGLSMKAHPENLMAVPVYDRCYTTTADEVFNVTSKSLRLGRLEIMGSGVTLVWSIPVIAKLPWGNDMVVQYNIHKVQVSYSERKTFYWTGAGMEYVEIICDPTSQKKISFTRKREEFTLTSLPEVTQQYELIKSIYKSDNGIRQSGPIYLISFRYGQSSSHIPMIAVHFNQTTKYAYMTKKFDWYNINQPITETSDIYLAVDNAIRHVDSGRFEIKLGIKKWANNIMVAVLQIRTSLPSYENLATAEASDGGIFEEPTTVGYLV